MKRLPPFMMAQPESVAEASTLLAEHEGTASLYAGGTELLLAMKEGLLGYDLLIDVKTISELNVLQVDDGQLLIGAAVTHAQLERSPLVWEALPALAAVERRVANPRVRATGTLVGNLCFAEPHSDPATLLLCLDAQVVVESQGEARTLGLDAFLVGAYETAIADDELVTRVVIPLPGRQRRIGYEKFIIHERPTLGLAVVFDTDDTGEAISGARVAVGCVSPTPCRSAAAEAVLTGPLDTIEARLDEAAAALAADAALLDDADGSAAYKEELIRVFLRRATRSALNGAAHAAA
jgi:carbon-monoxide dehydrogenase medium subunit